MKALHEIIRVVEPAFLVNSSKHACRYETADGNPLAPGYYFALWPAKAMTQIYNRDVRYFGPFATRNEAQLWQDSAVAIKKSSGLKTQGERDGGHSVSAHSVELGRATRNARRLPQQLSQATPGDLARG